MQQTKTQTHIDYLDILRVLAAFFVVAIHVLGPYRFQIGDIALSDWVVAVGLNSASRWAVPIFIMISGLLLLSSTRPFSLRHFIRRRVVKVVVPFLVWSLAFACLSGLTPDGFSWQTVVQTLEAAPDHETYYHLGFFYYYIPLLLWVPLLRPLVPRLPPWSVALVGMAWIGVTAWYLTGAHGWWRNDFILYGGYLWLGYWLHQAPRALSLWWGLGLLALGMTEYHVLTTSVTHQQYITEGWLSYTTVNTVLISAALFLAVRQWRAGKATPSWLATLSRYSLGIYLIHPVFLWPVRAYWPTLSPALVWIPLLTLYAFAGAALTTAVLQRYRATAWLVP
ncbi:acyltransferase [Salinivibrio kushneri]|uniref:acyltransferase n=1 Tax=Salinivibrio kushneri TaxID=1908198 RepID=UPI0022B2BD86|nr:acyltransferase [Salinivibrio kushneri]WBA11731.1 acyltransferase [Salinivibrio kushneri]